MGWQHIRDGELTVRQQKTGAVVVIPILPELRQCLNALERKHLTFIVTEYGKPFSSAGFTNWFRDKCAEAGLSSGLSPHGLRKAMCRRLADAGCTPHAIMSISGHKTLAEVTRYTEPADRTRLAQGAMEIIRTRTSNGKPDA